MPQELQSLSDLKKDLKEDLEEDLEEDLKAKRLYFLDTRYLSVKNDLLREKNTQKNINEIINNFQTFLLKSPKDRWEPGPELINEEQQKKVFEALLNDVAKEAGPKRLANIISALEEKGLIKIENIDHTTAINQEDQILEIAKKEIELNLLHTKKELASWLREEPQKQQVIDEFDKFQASHEPDNVEMKNVANKYMLTDMFESAAKVVEVGVIAMGACAAVSLVLVPTPLFPIAAPAVAGFVLAMPASLLITAPIGAAIGAFKSKAKHKENIGPVHDLKYDELRKEIKKINFKDKNTKAFADRNREKITPRILKSIIESQEIKLDDKLRELDYTPNNSKDNNLQAAIQIKLKAMDKAIEEKTQELKAVLAKTQDTQQKNVQKTKAQTVTPDLASKAQNLAPTKESKKPLSKSTKPPQTTRNTNRKRSNSLGY